MYATRHKPVLQVFAASELSSDIFQMASLWSLTMPANIEIGFVGTYVRRF